MLTIHNQLLTNQCTFAPVLIRDFISHRILPDESEHLKLFNYDLRKKLYFCSYLDHCYSVIFSANSALFTNADVSSAQKLNVCQGKPALNLSVKYASCNQVRDIAHMQEIPHPGTLSVTSRTYIAYKLCHFS